MKMLMLVLWAMTLIFRGRYQRLALKMSAKYSSETLVSIYKFALRYYSGDHYQHVEINLHGIQESGK
jgi:hypothetical protein